MVREIDLIPSDYRRQRDLSRWVKSTVIIGLAVMLINTAGYAYLFYRTKQIDSEVSALQIKKEVSSKQRIELGQVKKKKEELENQLQLLTGLRSGSAAEQIFRIVDRAMTAKEVWFVGWKFRRAEKIAKPEKKTVSTGYFLVVPKGKKENKEAWQIETHMTIKGQALDHAALSSFVTRLIDQPGIRSVRVLRTSLREYKRVKLVDFSIAVTVAAKES